MFYYSKLIVFVPMITLRAPGHQQDDNIKANKTAQNNYEVHIECWSFQARGLRTIYRLTCESVYQNIYFNWKTCNFI